MSGVYKAGTYNASYTLSATGQDPFTLGATGLITITSTIALIGAAGIDWSVLNQGRIDGGWGGILLKGSGSVTNAADGVIRSGASYAVSGNSYSYGIEIVGADAMVTNFGSVISRAGGIALRGGGTVINGSTADTTALVAGTVGNAGIVVGNPGTVFNFGTVQGAYRYGIDLASGLIVNGATNDLAARIVSNGYGVAVTGFSPSLGVLDGSGTVVNAGTILGGRFTGVLLDVGGTVSNGGSADPAALIAGVDILRGGSLANGGTITQGAYLSGVGQVSNGGPGDSTALISGGLGVTFGASAVNNGTIENLASAGAGVGLGTSGESLVNGSATDRSALILGAGYGAIANYASAYAGHPAADTITNFGTIAGTIGVFRPNGANYARPIVVTNAGTIESLLGASGTAVALTGRDGTLVVDPGAVFIGSVMGNAAGGSVLELGSASAAGTLAGLGTVFTGFSEIALAVGANWTLAGANSIASGVTLSDPGTIVIGGTLTNAGSIVGTVTLLGGTGLYNTSSGTITGSAYAPRTDTGTVAVTNAGLISNAGAAVLLDTGGAVTNTAHGIILSASGNAVQMASTAQVYNAGTIASQSATWSAVYFRNNGAVTNAAHALIQGAYRAIDALGTVSIVNQGTILGTNVTYSAVALAAGTITNQSGGLIQGASYNAISLSGTGLIVNDRGGTIIGANMGVELGGTASIVNAGRIGGGVEAYYASGSSPTTAGAIYVTNTGTISGRNGVEVANGGSVTNGTSGNTTALITATAAGVYNGDSYGTVAVANYATIAGGPTNGFGVFIQNVGTISNNAGALIESRIGVQLAAGALYNTGTILGLGSLGAVGVQSGGTGSISVTNLGVISGTRFGVDVSDGANLVNTGIIAGTVGVYLNPGSLSGGGQLSGTLTNAGIISGSGGTAAALGQAATLVIDPGAVFLGTVTNAGTVPGWQMELGSAAAAGTLSGLGTQFTGFGGIQLAPGATWTLVGTNSPAYVLDITGGAGTLVNAGLLALSAGPSGGIGFAQQIDPALLVNTGTILASPASYTAIYSGLTGAGGVLQITDTGKLATKGSVAAGQSVIFAGTTAAGVLALSDPTGFAGTIDNFLPDDTILLSGSTATAGTMAAGNTLDVTLTAGTTLALAFSPTQSFTNDTFHFSALPGGAGTAITDSTPCYLAGTSILTDRGDRAVETLKPGDIVITQAGARRPIRWIGRRSFAAAFAAGNREVVPVRVRPGALEDGVPARDLYVSPQHALLLDGALVPAELLVNQASIQRCPDIDPIRYFHLELDSHDILLAEGAAAESFVDCDSRGMFHNAAEHDGAPTARWRFCAPRLESGPRLEAIRARIDARAGLAPTTAAGLLEGFLDPPAADRIDGWARDSGAHPVLLEVLVDGGIVARVPADQFREDLHAAGIGDGRHGFSVSLPTPLSPDRRHEITVRRVADGTLLPGAPQVLEPVAVPDTLAVTRRMIAAAVDRATDPAQAAALLAGLREASARLRARQHAPAAGAGRRALVIDARLPRPDRDAGSVALVSHIEAMHALGWTVDAIGADEPALTPEATAPLATLGVQALGLPELASVEELLRAAPERYDLIYLHRLAQAEAYAWLARRLQPRARILYNVADLHHLRLERQARIAGDLGLMAEARALRTRELAAMRAADAVLTHSAEEATYLAREAPGARVHVVPWSQPGRPVSLSFAARRGMALIGAPSHAPNADAARWLREEIMPRVWAEAPEIPCYLVGEGWAAHWPADADPRIQVLGPLARLDGLFEMIRLTVAPLRFGAGIKGKVLASLAAGLPCAMTPVAAEGLKLSPVLRGLVAEDAAGLATLILRLHAEAPAAALREGGMAMVARQFGPAAVRRAMAAALRASPPGGAGARRRQR